MCNPFHYTNSNINLLLMLILENLTLQAAKRSFLNSTTKFIKISINQHIASSKLPAKVRSATQLQWNETISLPLFLNAEYTFEIYDKHQFGYNPEELNKVVGGKIVVGENDTFNNWEVVGERKVKFGYLSANIRKRIKYVPSIAAILPEAQILSISSIIAHISSIKQKRAFVIVKISGKSHKTQICKSKSGELLFTDTMELQKTDEVLEATIEVHSYDAKQDKSELLGSGVLKMDPEKYEKRVVIRNQKGAEIGDAFIDHKVTPKDQYTTSKEISKIVQRASLLNKSIDIDRKNENYSLAASYLTKSLNKTSDEGSLMGSRSKSGRKVSIVNHNHNIFMPTEKRFTDYNDKQNQKISYLSDRHDFDFKQKHSKNYYKGAAIGVGEKFDFTHVFKQNPGVGVYNLPSIWDRY